MELAEQEMRRESAKAKRVEITLQAEQRARVDAEVRCEQVRIFKGRILSVEFCSKFYGSKIFRAQKYPKYSLQFYGVRLSELEN